MPANFVCTGPPEIFSPFLPNSPTLSYQECSNNFPSLSTNVLPKTPCDSNECSSTNVFLQTPFDVNDFSLPNYNVCQHTPISPEGFDQQYRFKFTTLQAGLNLPKNRYPVSAIQGSSSPSQMFTRQLVAGISAKIL